MREQFGAAYCLPEKNTILESVDIFVFEKAFIKTADGSEEDDRVDIIEVRVPRMALQNTKSGNHSPKCHYPKTIKYETDVIQVGLTMFRAPPTSYIHHS